MSGRKHQTNPLLLIIAILLCLSSGLFFRRSSFDPEYDSSQSPVSHIAQTLSASHTEDNSNSSKDTAPETPTPAADTLSPSATPTVSPVPDKQDTSPEAASGTWTSSGSNWLFMVNDTPYTGWLIDTDGKHYYFNSDGIMQTGWIEDNNKRYYTDLDGIMQTGTVSIDGKDYEFLSDGSLKE